MIQSEADIRSIVLKSEAGTAVTIGDVADVRTGHAVRQGASLKDGRGESVGGIVLMLRGENSRDVVAALEEKVREINESRVLPDGLRLVPFYRRSPIVEASTRTVLKALAEGVGARAWPCCCCCSGARAARSWSSWRSRSPSC